MKRAISLCLGVFLAFGPLTAQAQSVTFNTKFNPSVPNQGAPALAPAAVVQVNPQDLAAIAKLTAQVKADKQAVANTEHAFEFAVRAFDVDSNSTAWVSSANPDHDDGRESARKDYVQAQLIYQAALAQLQACVSGVTSRCYS